MNLDSITTIEELWKYTQDLHKDHFPNSRLKPVMSGGKLHKPKFMFVFINPTYRNVSSDLGWSGLSRPWVGTKYIWKIFYNSGNFSKELLDEINCRTTWDEDFANKVYNDLEAKSFYFTNIVKWTGENADLPDSSKIKLFTPILKKEISIVRPDFVVTFGLIPYKGLTNNNIRLSDIYEKTMAKNSLYYEPVSIENYSCNIVPCYFPVGRGNPKRATEILKYINYI